MEGIFKKNFRKDSTRKDSSKRIFFLKKKLSDERLKVIYLLNYFKLYQGVCHEGYVNSNFSKNDVEQEKLTIKCKPFQNRKHDLEFK